MEVKEMSGLWIPELQQAQRTRLADLADEERLYHGIMVAEARAERRRRRRAAVRAWLYSRTRGR